MVEKRGRRNTTAAMAETIFSQVSKKAKHFFMLAQKGTVFEQ